MSRDRIVVVGAGVAGLSTATNLRRLAPEIEVVVLEAQARVGGLVETERTSSGFLMEHGADSLVTTKPRGLAAVRAAGLGGDIVAGAGSRRSYVAGRDGLVPMPVFDESGRKIGYRRAISDLDENQLRTISDATEIGRAHV